ncbi:MAG: HD domain-containing protein [Clostridia bacterium]|nr:HD domain-containing protein [Clostridia bacterium]
MATFYDEIYELKNVLRKGWMHYGVTSEHDRYESDAEMKCVKRLAKNYHLPNILKLWEEFEKKESKEAIFVQEMDRFDAIKQSKIYAEKYNKPEIFEDFSSNNQEIADKYKKYL